MPSWYDAASDVILCAVSVVSQTSLHCDYFLIRCGFTHILNIKIYQSVCVFSLGAAPGNFSIK